MKSGKLTNDPVMLIYLMCCSLPKSEAFKHAIAISGTDIFLQNAFSLFGNCKYFTKKKFLTHNR